MLFDGLLGDNENGKIKVNYIGCGWCVNWELRILEAPLHIGVKSHTTKVLLSISSKSVTISSMVS